MNKLHVKKGDNVIVLSGKDKGKEGKVLEVAPKEGKVIVEKINIVKKHVKPRRQGDMGGIIEAEGALYACKVQLVCPKCKKGTRAGYKVLEDGKKVRVCKHCNESF
ncbi:MAG: 50S ribosomal protein L24 [Ruminococcaceae bacterium]|nr:50S ribosomal protein L24 [Oscillospiraceae bacterium]